MNNLKHKLHHELAHFDPQKGLQNQQDVLRLLNVVLEQSVESTTDRAPPLDVIIYALNGILYPTFLPELMSDFLHLLTMVEFYRQRIVEKATLVIELNTYYHASPDPSFLLLTDEEEKYFTRLIEQQVDMRKIYMNIVTECCILDLRRVWLSGSNVDFWSRWHEYLSVLNGANDHRPPHSIHYNLSPDEIKEFRNVGLVVHQFMKTTIELAQQAGPSIHQAIKNPDFQDAHLPKDFLDHILQPIRYYIDVVRDAVQKFFQYDEPGNKYN